LFVTIVVFAVAQLSAGLTFDARDQTIGGTAPTLAAATVDFEAFVNFGVAVVVHQVADLDGVGMDGGACPIAVQCVGDVARNGCARHERLLGVAVTIRVLVEIIRLVDDFFVDHVVAVVIQLIARLGSARKFRLIVVVAVTRRSHEAAQAYAVGQKLRRHADPVAVVVSV
jgi:type IV secretory pathway VirB3-like protein